jgi:hypothetical protein
MAFQENSLGNTRIFNFRLDDVQCVVFEVVVHYTFTDAVVFVRVLDNRLLEVSIKFKYLAVVLKPFGSNLRDRVVLVLLAGCDASEAGNFTFTHGLKQVVIDFLLQICCFL